MANMRGRFVLYGIVIAILTIIFTSTFPIVKRTALAANDTVVDISVPRLSHRTINLKIGSTTKVKVKSYSGSIKWSTTNKKVAKVNSKGKVTARKKGNCILKAVLDDGTELTAKIKVTKNLSYKGITRIAHRGYVDSYPENTLPAFEGAMENGYDGVELDVFYTKSGDLMVFHDTTLYRMCKKNVSIWNVSVSNRTNYPIKLSGYASRHKVYIPTLEESLKLLKKTNATVYIHVKYEGDDVGQNAVDSIVATVKKTSMTDNSVIFCESKTILDRFKSRGIKRGILVNISKYKECCDVLDWCKNEGVEYYFSMLPSRISLDISDYAHDLEIRIGAYATQNYKEFQHLKDVNADFAMEYSDIK